MAKELRSSKVRVAKGKEGEGRERKGGSDVILVCPWADCVYLICFRDLFFCLAL